MNADNTQPDSLSAKVLGAVFEVSNTLGAGFLEKVYQRAWLRELGLRGIRVSGSDSSVDLPSRLPRGRREHWSRPNPLSN